VILGALTSRGEVIVVGRVMRVVIALASLSVLMYLAGASHLWM
jgi:hypothetical protein